MGLFPGVDGGGAVSVAAAGTSQPAGDAAPVLWWNPDGATPAGVCVGAYQAKSAASYAASKVNLPAPGMFDLTEIGGATPWAPAGWGCVAGLARCLNTGIVVAASTWSALVQFSGVVGTNTGLFGVSIAANFFYIQPNRAAGAVGYFNSGGGAVVVPPSHLTGNLGMAGKQGYRDGGVDGGPIGGAGAPAAVPLYIGAVNFGGAALFITANIESFVIYNIQLTAPQMLARAAAMALL